MTEVENTEEVSQTESQGDASEAQPAQSSQEQAVKAILDLDTVERFKWGGQEWTPKDLQGAILRQSDYTRKTQALSDQRKEFEGTKKYYDNLGTDLERVKANPALAAEFRKVYPKEFHNYLRHAGVETTQQQQGQQVPQEWLDKISKLEEQLGSVTGAQREREVQAIQAELDSTFSKLSEKYPFADESAVLARAEALLRSDPNMKVTSAVWDDLWKSVHSRTEALVKQSQSKQVKGQLEANKKAQDGAPGGGIPGQKPVKARSIREMTRMLHESGALG